MTIINSREKEKVPELVFLWEEGDMKEGEERQRYEDLFFVFVIQKFD